MTRYTINRNVNRPIEFKGLRAQYILYAGIALVANLLLFVILYLVGVNSYVCAAVCLLSGSGSVGLMFRSSRKYGAYG